MTLTRCIEPAIELPRLYCRAGSVLGREHARLHRNNQDGVALGGNSDHVVAVVTDGCSSGRYSEVGARIGASLLAARLPALRSLHRDDEAFAAASLELLVESLAAIVAPLPTEQHPPFVRDHLLFTFLVAWVERARDHAVVFGLGDGVIAIDGHTRILDSGAENAPSYAAYRLLDPASLTSFESHALTIHHCGPARSIAIATDGAIDALDELGDAIADPRHAANPTLLHKRLVVLGEVDRKLRDDTSVALIHRVSAPWTS